jgi:hypothetical protein
MANPHMKMVNHCFYMGIQTYSFLFPYGDHKMVTISCNSPYVNGIPNIRLPISIYQDHQMGIFKSTWEPMPLQQTILKSIPRDCQFPYRYGSVTNLFQNRVCDHLGIDKIRQIGMFSHIHSPFLYGNSSMETGR